MDAEIVVMLWFGVGQPAEYRVLGFVITFKIKMNESSFYFRKFFDLYLKTLSYSVRFFQGQIFREFNIDLSVGKLTVVSPPNIEWGMGNGDTTLLIAEVISQTNLELGID